MLILPLEILYALHLFGWFPALGLLALVGVSYGIAGVVFMMAAVNGDL